MGQLLAGRALFVGRNAAYLLGLALLWSACESDEDGSPSATGGTGARGGAASGGTASEQGGNKTTGGRAPSGGEGGATAGAPSGGHAQPGTGGELASGGGGESGSGESGGGGSGGGGSGGGGHSSGGGGTGGDSGGSGICGQAFTDVDGLPAIRESLAPYCAQNAADCPATVSDAMKVWHFCEEDGVGFVTTGCGLITVSYSGPVQLRRYTYLQSTGKLVGVYQWDDAPTPPCEVWGHYSGQQPEFCASASSCRYCGHLGVGESAPDCSVADSGGAGAGGLGGSGAASQ